MAVYHHHYIGREPRGVRIRLGVVMVIQNVRKPTLTYRWLRRLMKSKNRKVVLVLVCRKASF